MTTTGRTTYDHPDLGTITARPVTDQTTQADWIACDVDSRDGVNRVFGYVVDLRADRGGEPSTASPDDPDAKPFDVFSVSGWYVTNTHSLRAALCAAGERYLSSRRLH